MNLTKLEKSIIIILVVGGILAAGIFMFVLPSYNKIGTAEKNLKAAQMQQQELEEKLSREATIDSEISGAKEEAEKLEVNFYPDLTTYEAVEIVLAYLKDCNLETYGVSASALTTDNLVMSVYKPAEVLYDLKTFAGIARGKDENALLEGEFLDNNKKYSVMVNGVKDVFITDVDSGEEVPASRYTETMKKAYKEALCSYMVSSGSVQTLGATSVSFTVSGTYGDYMNFIDYIFGLNRATMMKSVVIPMTASVQSIEKIFGVDQEGNMTVDENSTSETMEYTDEMPVEMDISLVFFSVDPMKELETIDAAGEKIVVNQ